MKSSEKVAASSSRDYASVPIVAGTSAAEAQSLSSPRMFHVALS